MKKAGVSTAVIREIMGHSSERVTQIYLDSFDNEQINSAMKNLLEKPLYFAPLGNRIALFGRDMIAPFGSNNINHLIVSIVSDFLCRFVVP